MTSPPAAPPGAEEQFVIAAVRRMYWWMAAFGAGGTLALVVWRGWFHACGFALGAGLSALNFRWLKAAVDALGVAAANQPVRGQGRLVAKFVLRYALIGVTAYVIFRTSVLSLPAFLGGLFVFAAGVLAEMVYQLFRGSAPDSGVR